MPALGGYLFLLTCYWTRHRLLRESGYHVVFRSAAVGLLLFAVSFLLIQCDAAAPRVGSFLARVFAKTPIEPSYHLSVAAAVVSIVLGYGGAHFLNLCGRFANRWPSRLMRWLPSPAVASRNAAARTGSFREVILSEAMSNAATRSVTARNAETGEPAPPQNSLVEVVTTAGKSYVAMVQRIEPALPGDTDVCLIPALSGYRDAATRDLVITTNYLPLLEPSRRADLRVAIPMSGIASVRPFDIEMYEEQFHNAPSRDSSGGSA